MSLFSRLDRRDRRPEIMDDPGLEPNRHISALRGLGRINSISRSAQMMWPELAALSATMPNRPIRVLDLASGGGDVTRRLSRLAQHTALPINFCGLDCSSTAVSYAERQNQLEGTQVEFRQLDLLHETWPDDCDAIICSLFLHHLDNQQAIELLTRVAATNARLVLLNDLIRCRRGLFLAYLAGRLFTTSDVVRVDAVRSVRAAFTITEAAELVQQAGLTGATIQKHWPCRFLLKWARPTGSST